MIYELFFPLSILAVEPNRETFVIVLEIEIYIYEHEAATGYRDDGRCVCITTHADLDTNKTTAICALSPSADSSYLAYPSPVPSSTPLATATSVPPPASTSLQNQFGGILLFSA